MTPPRTPHGGAVRDRIDFIGFWVGSDAGTAHGIVRRKRHGNDAHCCWQYRLFAAYSIHDSSNDASRAMWSSTELIRPNRHTGYLLKLFNVGTGGRLPTGTKLSRVEPGLS
jgi:hypothetical protein